MLRLFRNFACLLALPLGFSSALAQTPSAPQQDTPQVQALTSRLINEINGNLACSANVIALQDAVKKLNTELAEAKKAEGKPEKKKP